MMEQLIRTEEFLRIKIGKKICFFNVIECYLRVMKISSGDKVHLMCYRR